MDIATGLLRNRSEFIPTQPMMRVMMRAIIRTNTPPLRRLRWKIRLLRKLHRKLSDLESIW